MLKTEQRNWKMDEGNLLKITMRVYCLKGYQWIFYGILAEKWQGKDESKDQSQKTKRHPCLG